MKTARQTKTDRYTNREIHREGETDRLTHRQIQVVYAKTENKHTEKQASGQCGQNNQTSFLI